MDRFFTVSEIIKGLSSDDRATKIVLYENDRTNTAIWYVPPGEEVVAHWHPNSDDIWVILAGEGEYYLGDGTTYTIQAGMVAVAFKGQIHGVKAKGSEPLIFVAFQSPVPAEMIKAGRQ